VKPLAVRKEQQLWAFEEKCGEENKLSGPMGKEVTTGCRKVHNEELHTFYCSPNIRVIQLRRL
jgi:hypothetical protein